MTVLCLRNNNCCDARKKGETRRARLTPLLLHVAGPVHLSLPRARPPISEENPKKKIGGVHFGGKMHCEMPFTKESTQIHLLTSNIGMGFGGMWVRCARVCVRACARARVCVRAGMRGV